MATKRQRNIFLISLSSVAAMVVLLFLFLSPIAKYLIERYDKELCGRELKLQYAYVNPFTGYIQLKGLTAYELQGDSVFISTKSVHAYISIAKLFSRVVEINNLTLDAPRARFIQNKKVFNFDDIIQKFSTHATGHSSWSVELINEKIENGEFHFIDKIIPINYFIKETNITFSGKLNQGDKIAAQFSCKAGIGTGDMKGNFTIDSKTKGYRFAVRVHDLDLEIIRQYIWELINYGMFTAHLDADLHASGNFNSKDSISLRGRMEVRDFHLGKTNTDDYAAFKNLVMVAQEVSPLKKRYLFDRSEEHTSELQSL